MRIWESQSRCSTNLRFDTLQEISAIILIGDASHIQCPMDSESLTHQCILVIMSNLDEFPEFSRNSSKLDDTGVPKSPDVAVLDFTALWEFCFLVCWLSAGNRQEDKIKHSCSKNYILPLLKGYILEDIGRHVLFLVIWNSELVLCRWRQKRH